MPPEDVLLGPLTRTITAEAEWINEDKFPAWQVWADEIERVLEHLLAQDQFGQFLPRLRDVDAKHRDATLAEARVSFFFFRNRFHILEYGPAGADGTEGDLLVQWRDTTPIFVETKGPSWRGELLPRTEEERKNLTSEQWQSIKERFQEPKYKDLEGRWIDPVGQALWVVKENALKKFFDDRPNLVVIADDFFVTSVGFPNLMAIVEQQIGGPGYERLGGILFIKPECWNSEIEYLIDFVENERALPQCRLPTEVAKGFLASTEESRRTKKERFNR